MSKKEVGMRNAGTPSLPPVLPAIRAALGWATSEPSAADIEPVKRTQDVTAGDRMVVAKLEDVRRSIARGVMWGMFQYTFLIFALYLLLSVVSCSYYEYRYWSDPNFREFYYEDGTPRRR